MKIITGTTGTAHVTSADDGALNAALWGAQCIVLPIGNKFEAVQQAATTIRIKSGDLMMYGRHGRIPHGSYEDLTISNGQTGYNRIDLIVAEYSMENQIENMELKVLKGIPSTGTPATPAYESGNILEGATLCQMPLYQVAVNGVNLGTITKLFSNKIEHLRGLINVYSSTEINSMINQLNQDFNGSINTLVQSINTKAGINDMNYADSELSKKIDSTNQDIHSKNQANVKAHDNLASSIATVKTSVEKTSEITEIEGKLNATYTPSGSSCKIRSYSKLGFAIVTAYVATRDNKTYSANQSIELFSSVLKSSVSVVPLAVQHTADVKMVAWYEDGKVYIRPKENFTSNYLLRISGVIPVKQDK